MKIRRGTRYDRKWKAKTKCGGERRGHERRAKVEVKRASDGVIVAVACGRANAEMTKTETDETYHFTANSRANFFIATLSQLSYWKLFREQFINWHVTTNGFLYSKIGDTLGIPFCPLITPFSLAHSLARSLHSKRNFQYSTAMQFIASKFLLIVYS